jgi:hypothetical protein
VKTAKTNAYSRAWCWALMAAVAVAIAGCGRAATDRRSVSGEVTLDGKPVDGGNIQIDPLDAKQTSATGALIQVGRYSIPRQTGLAPGKYRVRIYWADRKVKADSVPGAPGSAGPPGPMSVAPLKELIPAKYNTESELTIEVLPNDANKFDFALSTGTIGLR